MTDRYTEFLAGERHEDVAIYLTEDVVSNVESLADRDDAVAHDDAVVLVLDGERGRSVFQKTTGMAAMEFAQEAMGADGHVDRDLAGGECPKPTGTRITTSRSSSRSPKRRTRRSAVSTRRAPSSTPTRTASAARATRNAGSVRNSAEPSGREGPRRDER